MLLLSIPLLAGVSVLTYEQIVGERAHLRDLRVAQVDSFELLQLQLDEETGLRGYTSTGDRTFLEPYQVAEKRFGLSYVRLAEALEQFAVPGALRALDAARQDHRKWLATVAQPLIAKPFTAGAAGLQIRGKRLIDSFRRNITHLHTFLNEGLDEADRRTTAAIRRTLFLGLLSSCFVLLLGLMFAQLAGRASRRVFEATLLYENEKRIANLLQTTFLQKALPSSPGVEFHATYLPAGDEALVGGDWYDVFDLARGSLLFSIGDVAGHGLEAAVVMSRARQAIIIAALQESDPAIVLSRANNSIRLQEGRMVTAICGYVVPRGFEVVYATAGHPPPIVIRPGRAPEFLPHGGVALGVAADAEYQRFTVDAGRGALLVFYTDGVIEQGRDITGGEARLLQAASLASNDENPARAIARAVFRGEPPADDVAILTVRFGGLGPDDSRASSPS